MDIIVKSAYVMLDPGELAAVRAAMYIYRAAIASDFFENPDFDRLVNDTSAAIDAYDDNPDNPFPALYLTVIWNALQYLIDTADPADADRARFCKHLARYILPFVDFQTDVSTWYAEKERT